MPHICSMRSCLFSFCLLIVLSADAQPTWQVVGRSALLPDGRMELISSGAHFDLSFSGRECRIVFSVAAADAHSYVQYELDGQYVGRFRVGYPGSLVIKAKKNGRHRVRLFKTTEASSGPLYVDSVIGKKVAAERPPSLPLIEFIGNSITCGAAADPGEIPCGTGSYHDQHNAYFAYGPRVARAIGADFILNSVSGIGIYRTWNRDHPSMPLVYGNTHFQAEGDRPWNHQLFKPKVVSIALGTNDLSRGDGKSARQPFDSVVFVNRYIGFVRQVKAAQPQARIVLLSSGMVSGENRELLQRCLMTVKYSIDLSYPTDPQVVVHFFKPMKAKGCTGHPDVEDHGILAAELTELFRGLIH